MPILDERALALEARDVVLRTMQERQHRDQMLRRTIEAVEAENPGMSPERVKAAIVSLLSCQRNSLGPSTVCKAMKRLAFVLLTALLLAACASPRPTPSPTLLASTRLAGTPAPSAPASPSATQGTFTVDCGPLAQDEAACIEVVSVAVTTLRVPHPPLTAVRVQAAAPLPTCPPGTGCPLGIRADVEVVLVTDRVQAVVPLLRKPDGVWALITSLE